MDYPETAAFFEIIDLRSGDTIAAFDAAHDAEEALGEMVDAAPGEGQFLGLTYFTDQGIAIGSRLVTERAPEPAWSS